MPEQRIDRATTTMAEASAATRLLVSSNGTYAVAELAGSWREDEYGFRDDEVPPVLKVIEVGTGAIVSTHDGWALGPPRDDGEQLYLEEVDEEYRYVVRSNKRSDAVARLEPPPGFWLPKATVGNGGSLAAVILWTAEPGYQWRDQAERRQQLWIAAIDTDRLEVSTSKTLSSAMPSRGRTHFGVGVAMHPSRAELYLVELPVLGGAPTWQLAAVDLATLDTRWRAQLPVPPKAAVAPLPTDDDDLVTRIPIVDAEPTVFDERVRNGVMAAVTGDGDHIVTIHGRMGQGQYIQPDALHVVATRTGDVERTIVHDVSQLAPVASAVSVAGEPRVALLHIVSYREGMTESVATSFRGVSIVDAAGTVTSAFEVSLTALGAEQYERYKTMVPGAVAVHGDRLLLAPPASGVGEGRDAQELAGLVHTPSIWHTEQRPRVIARERHMEDAQAPR